VSKIRAYNGDKVENNGPLPDGSNISDEELLLFYGDEGNHIKRAVCASYEMLAGAWSAYAGEHELGPENEAFEQAKAYADRAVNGRRVWGFNKEESDTPSSNRGVWIPAQPGS
jgi:hypothetical protein